MKIPKLSFNLDPEYDANIAWNFYNHKTFAGTDFWKKGALENHNELIKLENIKNKKIFLKKYVNNIYTSNSTNFLLRKKDIEQLYADKQKQFFSTSNDLFKNHPWPSGVYKCYLSVFNFCPRFLETKKFFVFMYDEDNIILFTIIHEMLHFIFYDYCNKKYKDIFITKDTEKGQFWEIAEVFNMTVQQTQPFIDLHHEINFSDYPKLNALKLESKKMWDGDVDNWIKNFAIPYMLKHK